MMPVAIFLGITAVILLAVCWRIDDWSRDLTSNHAALDANSKDPLLRPQVVATPAGRLVDQLARSLRDDPSWSVVSQEQADEVIRLHLTHQSQVFGFVDDVHVTIEQTPTGTRVDARSQSRIGKGDLGQNPRNLKSLVSVIRQISGGDVD